MKNKAVVSTLICCTLFPTVVLAEESAADEAQQIGIIPGEESPNDEALKDGSIQGIEQGLSKAELLTAVNVPKEKGRFHGTLGTNVEVEQVRRDDGLNEGKVKYTFAQGSFRHDDLPGWDFGFYSGREYLYNGDLFSATYDRGTNAIQELFVNRNYGFERGNIGWGVALKSESIDERTTPEGKVFGSYQITDRFDFHGYAMYNIEFKQNRGNFNYWEIEPGFGYKIADNSGAWLNFRLQQGEWVPKQGAKELETEWIIKPGVWYSWGKLSASLWGEFGKFEKEASATSAHLWTETYSKVGISANYPIAKNWRVFGETSYKWQDFKDGNDEEFGGYIPVFIAGINYSF
jgi:hypothetical protein